MLSKKVFRTSDKLSASRSRKRPQVEEKRPSSSALNTASPAMKESAGKHAEALPSNTAPGGRPQVRAASTTQTDSDTHVVLTKRTKPKGKSARRM